jgi:hypothetical protein
MLVFQAMFSVFYVGTLAVAIEIKSKALAAKAAPVVLTDSWGTCFSVHNSILPVDAVLIELVDFPHYESNPREKNHLPCPVAFPGSM